MATNGAPPAAATASDSAATLVIIQYVFEKCSLRFASGTAAAMSAASERSSAQAAD